MLNNPCHNCSKRHQGCHASCDDYKNWKAEWDEMRERERKRKDIHAKYQSQRFRKPFNVHRIRGDQ